MSYGPEWVIFGALVGGLIGAAGTIAGQVVNHRLSTEREHERAKAEHERLKVTSFENFRREFTSDEKLQRIDNKEGEPLTDDEIDYYIGFFEEIGIYFSRDLVDIDLVDEILGDSIILAYEDEHIRKSIYEARGGTKDPTYFVYFERLARELEKRKEARLK